ncbi:MAG: response regulator, partial [Lachnospiraceae bacterium]|nr:response regulator [Lachnospiraceae bacterium]
MNEIILELSAFCIVTFCLADCLKNRPALYIPIPKTWNERIRDQHFVFILQLVMLMMSALVSAAEVALENYSGVKNAYLLYVLNELYFILHAALSFVFTLYIINMTKTSREKSKAFFRIFLIPFVITEILVLANPFNGLIFYVDEQIAYRRGDYMWILYAVGGFYLLFGIIYFIKYKNRLSKTDRLSTLILIFIAIIGIIIQLAFSIPVELFFEAVGFLGFMMLLEVNDYRARNGKSGRVGKGFILVIALIFTTVITINIGLIYKTGSDQASRTGSIQLENIRGELQETISDAEGNLLKCAMGVEQLLTESAGLDTVQDYIREQKTYYNDISSGNCFNVYAAAHEWSVILDFDMPAHYHPVERVWYIGASQEPGQVYISEPYIDAATGDLCFTMSYMLSDKDTVVAMDYTLSKVQDIIRRMGSSDGQKALIVTREGTIVGCYDTNFLGGDILGELPAYGDIFEWVKSSKEHRSFNTKVGRTKKVVFSSETNNGWLLILIEDSDRLYGDIYAQMIMLGAVDMLMIAVIIVFYMVSINNQEKAENALESAENFMASLSDDLNRPLDDILRISDESIKEYTLDKTEALLSIRQSGNRLKEKLDNLLSYSDMIRTKDAENIKGERAAKKGRSSFSSKYIRNGIIGIILVAMLMGLFLCLGITTKWGTTRISKEADKYNSELTQWMLKQQSTLRMFSDVIAADPSVLDDYDKAVKWLDDIAKNYSEMSFCYMANPYNTEHAIIMNNGWVPDPDYKVEERQWYIDTERSGDGYSISAPYYDAQTGLYCITFSRSVYSQDGDFLGVFAIDCFIDKLIDVLADSYTDESYAFLVDQDGVIINHPDKDYELSEQATVNIEDTEYADVYHNTSVFGMYDYDGRYVASYAEKSSISGFTVIVVQSWWSIYGTVLLMAAVFLLMLIISIIAIAVLINRFISWQEETNEKLVEAANEAVSAGKAKSRFLAQMSHEIRTPINAVLGMNEMILRESGDEAIHEYAGNIQSAGKNLLGLINSILDFSKIEEGKMEIIPVRYDTAVMVENLVNSISQRAQDKGLVFEAHVDENLPSALYGDDMRLTQVVVNLLTNAVKYTREGRVDLYIDEAGRTDDKITLAVKVKDTGIGIKSEDIEKLFESFTRLEETRNRNIEGTGLGMAIVTRLLDMMGSGLEVKSTYGEGSEFSFKIQQTVMDDEPLGDYAQKAKQLTGRTDDGTYLYAPKARLLIVDDNELNLKVIKNLLKLNGIVPDLASSGKQALTMLEKNKYDIVFLDHMMPEMDGIETLEAARNKGLVGENDIVIALTANAVVGARETYLAAGFDEYLSKPVDVRALESTLSRYLPSEMKQYLKKGDIKSDRDKEKELGDKKAGDDQNKEKALADEEIL